LSFKKHASTISDQSWSGGLSVYQPGRPIEEVARELGLPAEDIIKLASNENPLGPSPAALAAMRKVLDNINLYPDGNAFYLRQQLSQKLNIGPDH
jgi:histidinol-phosphate aminotransferase